MGRSLVIYAVLGLAACGGPTPNAELADLPGLQLSVTVEDLKDYDDDDRTPTDVGVTLSYDYDAFRAAHGGDCAVLGSVEATFDGHELSLAYEGGDESDFDGCYQPQLQANLELQAVDESIVTIRDDTLTATATYTAGVVAPRIATLRSPSEWSFGAGDTVIVAWSHPEDLVGASADTVEFSSSRNGDPGFRAPATYVDDEIHLAIPTWADDSDGSLRFVFGPDGGDATTCTGATACTWYSVLGYRHAVSIDG